MPLVRTLDILNLFEDLYKQIRLGCDEMGTRRETALKGVGLNAVRHHALKLESEIRSLKTAVPSQTLDARFRFSSGPFDLGIDPTARIAPDMTVDDLLHVVVDFDVALVALCRRAIASTALAEVQQLFVSLVQLIQTANESLSRER